MRFVLITRDAQIEAAAREGFHPSDTLEVFTDWPEALDRCEGADLLFVDMLATLEEPNKIGGYERFAHAKMTHPTAKNTPLVLISPPEEYELDFMAGWPDFVKLHYRQPVDYRVFRRASTWV